jgi:hypothetical protein
MGALIGKIIGVVIDAVDELSRQSLAKALREAAARIERGDMVSDDAIDRAKAATDRIRQLRKVVPS